MLKWARTIDWLAINTSALVLLVVAQVLSAFPPQPIKGPQLQAREHATQQPKEAETGFNWGFWEAFFTGLIALYAIRQYAESRRSSQRQLRAYVFIETCKLTRDPNWNEGPWEIHLSFKNFGATPATPFFYKIERDVRAPIAANTVIPFGEGAQESLPPPIPPGHFFTVRAPIMSVAHFQSAVAKKEWAYIWGQLHYTDIFGDEHRLRFQFEHELDNAVEFGFCTAGNELG